MSKPDRGGVPNSGEATFGNAVGTTPQTVINSRDDQLFEPNQIIIEYDPAATATVEVTIHDDPDGTAAGDVSTARKMIKNLSPGDVRSYDNLHLRDIDHDVLVQPDGNQDGEVAVYVDGLDIRSGIKG